MMLNATLRDDQPNISKLMDELDIEYSGPDSDTPSESSSDGSEMTAEDYERYLISSGRKSLKMAHKEAEAKFQDDLDEVLARQPRKNAYGIEVVQHWNDLTTVYLDHTMRIHQLLRGHQDMLQETDPGVRRSQQYQHALTDNLDYAPKIQKQLANCRKLRDEAKDQLQEYVRKEDVSQIDHPRHGEMTWSACWANACSIHYSSKYDSGFWPSKQISVFWPKKDNDDDHHSAKKEPKMSKN